MNLLYLIQNFLFQNPEIFCSMEPTQILSPSLENAIVVLKFIPLLVDGSALKYDFDTKS